MTYGPIFTPMGCECKGTLTTSQWGNDNNEEEEPIGTPKVVTVTSASSPQQYKAYKSSYFNRMLKKPSPRITPITQRIRDIITAQEEISSHKKHPTTELNQ